MISLKIFILKVKFEPSEIVEKIFDESLVGVLDIQENFILNQITELSKVEVPNKDGLASELLENIVKYVKENVKESPIKPDKDQRSTIEASSTTATATKKSSQ
jgi:hypothetical protein